MLDMVKFQGLYIDDSLLIPKCICTYLRSHRLSMHKNMRWLLQKQVKIVVLTYSFLNLTNWFVHNLKYEESWLRIWNSVAFSILRYCKRITKYFSNMIQMTAYRLLWIHNETFTIILYSRIIEYEYTKFWFIKALIFLISTTGALNLVIVFRILRTTWQYDEKRFCSIRRVDHERKHSVY